ncbi:MAG: hypothetical protein ACO25B_09530 [Chitinophagaceae bacterium]
MFESDGKGDEVFFTFIYSVADSNGNTKYRGKVSTKTYGDQNGFPNRIKAGSLSQKGGMKQGDVIRAQSSPDDTLLTFGFDLPTYSSPRAIPGTLVLDRMLDVGDFISIFPVIWEWDNTGPAVQSELEAFVMNSMDTVNKRLIRWVRQFEREYQYRVGGYSSAG